MQRRQFLAATLATSALAVARATDAQAHPARSREFYQIRRYQLQSDLKPASPKGTLPMR